MPLHPDAFRSDRGSARGKERRDETGFTGRMFEPAGSRALSGTNLGGLRRGGKHYACLRDQRGAKPQDRSAEVHASGYGSLKCTL